MDDWKSELHCEVCGATLGWVMVVEGEEDMADFRCNEHVPDLEEDEMMHREEYLTDEDIVEMMPKPAWHYGAEAGGVVMESVAYYEGALGAYEEEAEVAYKNARYVRERASQFRQLLGDYQEARDKIVELERKLEELSR